MELRDQRRRLGVLTSGGDCPGLNAVIRGVVKSADYLGYEVLGFLDGFEGLATPVRYRRLDYANTSGILTQGGTILGSTNKGRFGATKGESQRVGLDRNLLGEVAKNLDQLDVDGLVCIGGDGSLTIANQFFEYGIPVVGVPKTIDNDLGCTAFSFGFDSAIACAAGCIGSIAHHGSESWACDGFGSDGASCGMDRIAWRHCRRRRRDPDSGNPLDL